MKQTHLHSWKWRMKIRLMCSSSRQEVSTKKGTCYFTPEFCYRPRIHSQLESRNLVPPHPDYYSRVFSLLSFPCPHFLIVHKVTGVCAQAYCAFFFFFFKLNGQCSVLIDSRWRWSGGKYWFCENTPCSISGMLAHQLLSLYSSKLFCSQCFNKRTQPQNPCIPCSIGEF